MGYDEHIIILKWILVKEFSWFVTVSSSDFFLTQCKNFIRERVSIKF